MSNFIRKWNELIFSPIALLVAGGVWYLALRFFGDTSGLMPPGYLVNIFFGAFIFYVSGFMATLGLRLNFPKYFKWMFDPNAESQSDSFKNRAVCVYLFYCGLAVWALTSML